jgi:predicted Zn-dependent protease
MLHNMRSFAPRLFSIIFTIATCCATLPMQAAGLLRDPDIEHGITQLSGQILRSAGLNPRRVKMLVVNDGGFNAFVIDSRAIYVNYGLILTVEDAAMLQAVIAHEAAHIANGHLARRVGALRNAGSVSSLGTILAVIAAAAGAGDAAAGIALGSQASAQRSFLAHTRAEESAADRSALGYISAAGKSAQGMVDVHGIFKGQDFLSEANQDPYMRSHPLNSDRVRAAKSYVEKYGDAGGVTPEDAYWFDRVKGKLSAFLRPPNWTLTRLKNQPETDVTHMRKAVAYHRLKQLEPAHTHMLAALELRPADPYYLELLGQILMENRQWQQALAAYQQAAELAPNEALILGGYGRVLLALDRPKEARATLEQARLRDDRDARVMMDLARAYAATGDDGLAALTTAERHALLGNMKDAAIQARRAATVLPRGSIGWQKAQDLISATQQNTKGND